MAADRIVMNKDGEITFSFTRCFCITKANDSPDLLRYIMETYNSEEFSLDYGLHLKLQMCIEGSLKYGSLKFALLLKSESQNNIRISSTTMNIVSNRNRETLETDVFPEKKIPFGDVNIEDFQKIYEHESKYQEGRIVKKIVVKDTKRGGAYLADEIIILPNTFYVDNGALTVTVKGKIFIIEEKPEEEQSYKNEVSSTKTHRKHLSDMLKNPQYSDVDICVNGKNFTAHKAMLCARSQGFAEMIHDLESKKGNNPVNIITINNFSSDVVEEGLFFMYTGTCHKIKEMAVDLFSFSSEFKMDDLKMLCETEIQSAVAVANVCAFYELADKYNAENIKEFCIKIFRNNSGEIIGSNCWNELKKCNPNAVIALLEAMALIEKK